MTAPDPALAKELDRLTTQVNPDNILAVHKVFRRGADDLLDQLLSLHGRTQVGLCGADPISKDASAAFGAKIAELLKAHWAHQQELDTAANHLRSIAHSYGITEAQIAGSLDGSARR